MGFSALYTGDLEGGLIFSGKTIELFASNVQSWNLINIEFYFEDKVLNLFAMQNTDSKQSGSGVILGNFTIR